VTDGAEPTLSVVIVTWNSRRVISDCLASIEHDLAGNPGELIVVDNASTDGTADLVASSHPATRVIRNRRNLGLAAGNNQGLRASTSSEILICNPDVTFRPGAIPAMRGVLRRHVEAGWVVPRLVATDGTALTSAGDLPTLLDALLGRQAARYRKPGGTRGFWWDEWAHDEERQIGRGHEAAYLVRRQAVDDVGLQDERYTLDWEGMDWSDRFRQAGWQTWLAPESEVVHVGGDSIRQAELRWIASHHRGMYLYFRDRMKPLWRPLLALAFAVRAAVKMAAAGAGLPLYRLAHGARNRTA
jgi:GT2 family glycosyltransferase